MANTEAQIKSFQEKNAKILEIYFTEHVRADDVSELVHASQKIESVFERIQKKKYYLKTDANSLSAKIFQRSMDKLDALFEEYFTTLSNLVKAKQLIRTITNTNLRRKIEQLGSSIAVEVEVLEEKHELLGKEASLTGKSESSESLESPRKDSEQDVVIEDAEGLEMWQKEIGPKAYMAEWEKLIAAVQKACGTKIADEQKKALKHILDNSNTGVVSSWKFSEFLRGFGPLSSCLDRVSKILSEKWFHGFLTKEEASKLLEFQPVGTFLLRFSSSKPGSFALAFTSAPNPPKNVTHVIIRTDPKGFAVQEDNSEKIFPKLNEIVQYYSGYLKLPFDSTLPEEPWFHGDIEAEEAHNLIKAKKPGTFLVRFSSQPNHFAVSYVESPNQVSKLLVQSNPFAVVQDPRFAHIGRFRTMRELIEALKSILKFPYSNTTNEVVNAVRKRIATEILDTERTYLKALETLFGVYYTPLLSQNKPVISQEDTKTIFMNIADITGIHKIFYSELEPIVASWSEDSKIGRVISNFVPNLKIYASYVNKYNTAMETLTRVLQVGAFKKFIETVNANENIVADLTSFLIQPIQRIPRYILLVADLLKHTTSDHIDFEDLTAALERIKQMADLINESKRGHENDQKLVALQNLLVGFDKKLVTPGRTYVREGALNQLDMKRNKTQERYFFLLTDVLIATKKKKDKYAFKQLLVLRASSCNPDPKVETRFILHREASTTAEGFELTIIAPSAADRNAWVKELRQAILDITAGLPAVSLSKTFSEGSLNAGPIKRSGSGSADRALSPTRSPPPERALPPGWKEASSSDGRRYYFHAVTKQTSWTFPSDHDSEWKEVTAPDGRTYYFNTITKASSWEKPF